jgi:hypothetical protein
MKRRKFVYSSIAAGTLPFLASSQSSEVNLQTEKELYELRTYEVRFRANQQLLKDYLKDVLKPSLIQQGVNHVMILGEYGMSDPANIHVLLSYPSADVYMKAQSLQTDMGYLSLAAGYNALAPEDALYNRYSSSLLLAFDGMPNMKEPLEEASIFELRSYEGYSEDAVRRKIKMFNEGEIDIFLKTGLNPVFFGEMIAGPYRPCLTYMLYFRDMEERDENWKKFVPHPDWKELSSKEEYANTVSNIRRIFLTPAIE